MPAGIWVDSRAGNTSTVMPAQPVSTPLFPFGKSWMAASAAMTRGAVATGQTDCRLVYSDAEIVGEYYLSIWHGIGRWSSAGQKNAQSPP